MDGYQCLTNTWRISMSVVRFVGKLDLITLCSCVRGKSNY